jgi:hypothetical protein
MTPLPVMPCKACAHVGVPKTKPGPSPYTMMARCAMCGGTIKQIPRPRTGRREAGGTHAQS